MWSIARGGVRAGRGDRGTTRGGRLKGLGDPSRVPPAHLIDGCRRESGDCRSSLLRERRGIKPRHIEPQLPPPPDFTKPTVLREPDAAVKRLTNAGPGNDGTERPHRRRQGFIQPCANAAPLALRMDEDLDPQLVQMVHAGDVVEFRHAEELPIRVLRHETMEREPRPIVAGILVPPLLLRPGMVGIHGTADRDGGAIVAGLERSDGPDGHERTLSHDPPQRQEDPGAYRVCDIHSPTRYPITAIPNPTTNMSNPLRKAVRPVKTLRAAPTPKWDSM